MWTCPASATVWRLRATRSIAPMRPLSAFLALLTVLATGCGLFVEDDRDLGAFGSYEGYQELRQEALATLDQAVGDAEASSLAACRTVPVGAKACGGPASYAVYSTEAGDPETVQQVAEEITRLDEQANREFGLYSTCSLVAEPTVVWVDGQCRAE